MTTTVSNLGPSSGGTLSFTNGLQQSGKVIQTVIVGTSDRLTFSQSNSGIGNSITPLEITFGPQRADSVIWLRWVVFCETHHDTVYTIHQNTTLIGWNDYASPAAARWSGVYTPWYDAADNNSNTPQVHTINWFQPAGSLGDRTYKLATRSSNSTNRTYYLNRTFSSTGSNVNEIGYSWGIAREIAG